MIVTACNIFTFFRTCPAPISSRSAWESMAQTGSPACVVGFGVVGHPWSEISQPWEVGVAHKAGALASFCRALRTCQTLVVYTCSEFYLHFSKWIHALWVFSYGASGKVVCSHVLTQFSPKACRWSNLVWKQFVSILLPPSKTSGPLNYFPKLWFGSWGWSFSLLPTLLSSQYSDLTRATMVVLFMCEYNTMTIFG